MAALNLFDTLLKVQTSTQFVDAGGAFSIFICIVIKSNTLLPTSDETRRCILYG